MMFVSDNLSEEAINNINQNIITIKEWIEASNKAFAKPDKEQRVFEDSTEEMKRRPVRMKTSRPVQQKRRRVVADVPAYKPSGFIGPVPY